MTKRILTIATLLTFAVLMTSCHDESSKDGIPAKGDETATMKSADNAAVDAKDPHAGHNHAAGEGHGEGDNVEGMDAKGADLTFADGTWGWTLADYIANGSGTRTFELDQISTDDDELSAEGGQQLDDLAAILKANPDMEVDIRCHSREAANGAARLAKKTATAARAGWVKTKLVSRGAISKNISSKGLADAELLAGVAGDDDSQRRITVTMTK